MRKNIWIKALSLFLCVVMVLPILTLLPLQSAAAAADSGSDISSSTSKETLYLDGVYYHIEKSMTYRGNNQYSLNINLQTSLSETDSPLSRIVAKNGYFTVPAGGAGYYLLELWGGKGAGGDTGLDADNPGGEGGAAGYVYARVWLNEGETLAYSIGTNGATVSEGVTGGGANGSGGEHGGAGYFEVGGGGGYSALYFFDNINEKFDSAWLTSDRTWQMPEEVRASQYVMIAAGGGGGGAGNSIFEPYAKDANGNIKTADGGAGGSIENGVSLKLENNADTGVVYPVQGYIFSGKNGKSSGTSTAYVGRGGSNVPGENISTSGGLITATTSPNDWTGTYTDDSAPGAGGAGNLRGGGGGAGYCGGSGGIMQGMAVAGNVGGGGGGSSFVAMHVGSGEKSTVAFGSELDASIRLLLAGVNGARDFTDVGGAFAYTYLGDGNSAPVLDTSYLTNVQVQGKISQYFDVISYTSSDGTYGDMGLPNQNGSMSYNADGTFTVVSANIDASTANQKGELLSLSFNIRPKAGFMGGNNVPLLESLDATITREGEEAKTISAGVKAATDNVNVPLQFSIKAASTMYTRNAGETVTLTGADLYTVEYPTFTSNSSLKDDDATNYKFIKSVSAYSIVRGRYTGTGNITGDAITNSSVIELNQDNPIQHFTVYFTVQPTSSTAAAVGPAIASSSKVWAIATISLVSEDVFDNFDGGRVTANKTLSYENGSYIFTQEMTQSYPILSDVKGSSDPYLYGDGRTFTATRPGYYLVQAWGADGGDGGDGRATAAAEESDVKYDSNGNVTGGYKDTGRVRGGAGGAGAACYGYIYLEAGDQLTFAHGAAGQSQEYVQAGVHLNTKTTVQYAYGNEHMANGKGGTGGAYTAVMLNKKDGNSAYLIIAGGGGGGGGASVGRGDSITSAAYTGESAALAPEATNDLLINVNAATEQERFAAYYGKSGKNGNAQAGNILGWVTGSMALSGAPGASYLNAELLNKGKTDDETVYVARLANMLAGEVLTSPQQNGNSAARVTYLCDDTVTEGLQNLHSLESGGAFSKYFELETDENGYMIDMVVDGESYDEKVVTDLAQGKKQVTYYKNGVVSGYFTYEVEKTSENGESKTAYRILDAKYLPVFEMVEGEGSNATTACVAKCGLTIAFRLKPAEGFLGGNDIPVLFEDPNSEFSSVCVWKAGGEPSYLAKKNISDYANVEVAYDLESHFAVQDGYVVLNGGDKNTTGTINTSALYTLSADLTTDEAWKSAHVMLVHPEHTDVTIAGNVTSVTRELTAKILPVAPAQKAAVSPNSEGVSVTKSAKIYVQYPVTYELNNITYEGEAVATRYGAFRVTLKPDQGYQLPSAISISPTITYTYDATTGEIVIAANRVSEPLTITASGEAQGFVMQYVWEDATGAQQIYEESYHAGDTVDYTYFNNTIASSITPKTGYVYIWEWGTVDGQQPLTMPGYRVLVTGRYEKIRYQLTINYVDSEGTPLCDAYTAQVAYGDSYSVTSPVVESYMASSAADQNGLPFDPFVVSGTMGNGDVTVTVVYTFGENELVILYLDKNGNELGRHTDTLGENGAYSVTSPAISGYTVRSGFEVVSGILQGKESKTIFVYYDANQYRVDFEYRYEGNTYPGGLGFSSATMDGNGFTMAEFGNVYSYNAATGEYGFPVPVTLGYLFDGWYTSTDWSVRVSEEDLVAITSPITLYAKWNEAQYSVTIRYDFVFGADDFKPGYEALLANGMKLHDSGYYYYQDILPAGTSYNYLIDTVEGYTPYFNYGLDSATSAQGSAITGTVAAMPMVYYVTYEINSYTVRFLDTGGEVRVPDGFAFEVPSFSKVWATQKLTYGKIPSYSVTDDIPYAYGKANAGTGEMYVQYAFQRVEWLSSLTGEHYDAKGELPAVTADVDYLSCYLAVENIASVWTSTAEGNRYATLVGYYAKWTDAVSAAASKVNKTNYATLRLLRSVDLRGTADATTITLTSGTSSYRTNPMWIDLNGCVLTTGTGVFDIQRALTIYDSVGTGAISVIATAGVTAFTVTSYTLTLGATVGGVSYPARITVQTSSGDATAVSGNGTLVMNAGATVEVSGAAAASGISVSTLTMNANAAVTVTGAAVVYGIKPSKLTVADSGSVRVSATSTGADAYAVWYENTANNMAFVLHAQANAPAGTAYGIYFSPNSTSKYLYTVGSANHLYTVTASGKNATALYGQRSGTARYIPTIYANMTASSTTGEARVLDTGSSSAKVATLQSGVTLLAESQSGVAYVVYKMYLTFAAGSNQTVITAKTQSGQAHTVYSSTITFASGKPDVLIKAESVTGEAAILRNMSLTGTYGANVKLQATTESGTACAFSTAGSNSYSALSATVTATAAGGIAIGARADSGTMTLGTDVKLTVSGETAYGVYVYGSGALSNTYASSSAVSVTATGTAYGIYNYGSINSTTMTYTVTAAQGDACGVHNRGTITSLSAPFTVTADMGKAVGVYNQGGNILAINRLFAVTASANAYGFVAASGTLQSSGIGTGFELKVTSNAANAYGLYAQNANIGAAGMSGSIQYGTISVQASSGTPHAFYGANGFKVYVRGETLYYKGSEAQDGVNGVEICEGYMQADSTIKPGYYYLKAREYTIIFKECDRNGNELGAPYVYTRTYKLGDTVLTDEPVHITTYTGYLSGWQSYSLLDPDPDHPTVVYSKYTAIEYKFTLFVDGEKKLETTYYYLDVIAQPSVTLSEGYEIEGWYTDYNFSEGTQYFFPNTMGATDLTLYGKKQGVYVEVLFDTAGGSEVTPNPAAGRYGETVSVTDPTRPGYAFLGWFDADGNLFCTEFTTMPMQSMTLYAGWKATVSLIVLGEPEAYTVRLNMWMDLNGNGTIDEGVDMLDPMDELTFEKGVHSMLDLSIYTYLSSFATLLSGEDVPYFFDSWKTADGTSVHLNSGIGSWGVTPDENGVIELYAEIGIRADAVEALDLLTLSYVMNNGTLIGNRETVAGVTYDFRLPYSLPMPITCDGAAGGCFYLTYRALFAGTHHILIESQTGNGNTLAQLSLRDMQGNERPVSEELGSNMVALSAQTELDVEMEKGDVLLVRCYYESAPEAADYLAMAAALPEGVSQTDRAMLDVFAMLHNAMDIRLYNGAEGGILSLPVYSDKNINGWKYKQDGTLSAEILSQITASILNKGDWFLHPDLELSALILYPTDEEAMAMLEGWLGTILPGREYDAEKLLGALNDLINTATIPASGAASFIWFWLGALNSENYEAMVDSVGNASLHFEKGLPLGTTLSLVDFAPAIFGGYPTYYYYIVTENNTKDIPLSHFVALGEMPESEKRFVGFSSAMIFNVSYNNAPRTLTEESISLVTDIGAADFAFTLSLQHTREEVLSEKPLPFELGTVSDATLPIYSMADRGYADDDMVLITMHLIDANGNPVWLPANFAAGQDILILNGMAGMPVGTVSQLNAALEYVGGSVLPAPLQLDFDALRYHGFTGTVHLELMVIPADLSLSYDNLSYLGAKTFVDTHYQVPVQLLDAPQITFVERKGMASAGEVLTLSTIVGELNTPVDIELYIYQRVGMQMQYTDACGKLLGEGYSVDASGRVTDLNLAEGESLTSGEMSLTLNSAESGIAAGVYFLVAYYGGNYAVYTLTVTP